MKGILKLYNLLSSFEEAKKTWMEAKGRIYEMLLAARPADLQALESVLGAAYKKYFSVNRWSQAVDQLEASLAIVE